jgi:hypothetical protein
MKVLPYIEDIYDLDTSQLQDLLLQINNEMKLGPKYAELPTGVDSFEKLSKKCKKLKHSIELEI